MGATSKFFAGKKAAAIQATKGSKIFPEVVLSAASLESANGVSKLAASYNNFFGVKASTGWKGKVINLPTTEYLNGKKVTVSQPFRWYENSTDSFKDYVRLLSTPRYVRAGVTTAPNALRQFEAIQKAGYATDPKYSDKLKAMLKSSGFKMVASIGGGVAALFLLGIFLLNRYGS